MSAFAQRELRCSRPVNQQSLCQHRVQKISVISRSFLNLERDCLEASQAMPRDPATRRARVGKFLVLIDFKNSSCQENRLSHISHRFAHVHAGLFDQCISLLFAELPLFH
jgi:hypothetical protein